MTAHISTDLSKSVLVGMTEPSESGPIVTDHMEKVLRLAARLLRSQGHSTMAEARTSQGLETDALSKDAYFYSLTGALLRAQAELTGNFRDEQYEVLEPIHDILCDMLRTKRLHVWNDLAVSGTHVANVLEDAAARRSREVRRLN